MATGPAEFVAWGCHLDFPSGDYLSAWEEGSIGPGVHCALVGRQDCRDSHVKGSGSNHFFDRAYKTTQVCQSGQHAMNWQ